VKLLEGKSPLPLRYGGAVDFNEWKEGGMYEEDESDDARITGNDQVDSEMYEGFMEYQNEPPPEFDFGGNDGSDEDEDDDDYSPFIWHPLDRMIHPTEADLPLANPASIKYEHRTLSRLSRQDY